MAYSYTAFTGNGSTTQYAVSFPYIRREHVAVTVAGIPSTFTWVNNSLIQMDAAPANGAAVRVYRTTPISAPLVDFADGATLVAADLDTNSRQSIYIQQELDDAQTDNLPNVIPNGNKGDITTSVGGTVWAINSSAVTEAKIATGAVTSAKILDGTIVNADVNASAGITTDKLSFTQAGTGAVARTVDSRLKEIVSVKDFGAVGDGTTNDTVALQAAADYAVANQRSLHFPAGTYLVRQRIRFAGATNIALTGEGLCNSRIHLYSLTGTDATAAVSISDNAAQVVVRGLYFTVDQNSVTRNCCLGIEKASSVFITDCFFGGALVNLSLRGVIDSGIDNCSFENGSDCGIRFDDNTGNIWSPSNPSIWTFGTARVGVNNCVIVTNGGGAASTNQFVFNGVTILKGLQTIFTGCQFYGNTDTNVYMQAAVDTHFIGCYFGDPVSNSSLKNCLMTNDATARVYLTSCNFGDGNAGATPVKDIISLGFVVGAEIHVVNCKVNVTPNRVVVYDTDVPAGLKTWVGGPAPISTLSGIAWAVCSDGRWMWSNGASRMYYKNSRPASTTDGALFSGGLEATATYDPPSLADGAGTTTTVTCTGAALGDLASVSFSLDLQGITVTAWVSASDTVSVRFQNESGGVLDLGSGTLRVRVDKA